MWQYIVRRIGISIIILFGISAILYTIIYSMPGDYVTSMVAGSRNVTPEMVARLRHIYGLDVGLAEGYVRWLGQAVRGNFGDSFYYLVPVTDVLKERMFNSFTLMLPAFILELLIGVAFGVMSATRQYSRFDYAVTAFAFVGLSVPSFFLATILKRVFAFGLRLVPPSYMIDPGAVGFDLFLSKASNYILPVACLTLLNVGMWMRYARTNMLDVLNSDYIRTARAKGLPERQVIYSHAFRNTLVPFVTLVGGQVPYLFGGAMITENLFEFPGIGWAGFKALQLGDVPLIMAVNIVLAALTLAGTLLADLSYALVDPRVRIGGSK